MDNIEQLEHVLVVNGAIEEVQVQDEAPCFLKLSLYEGECLSML